MKNNTLLRDTIHYFDAIFKPMKDKSVFDILVGLILQVDR